MQAHYKLKNCHCCGFVSENSLHHFNFGQWLSSDSEHVSSSPRIIFAKFQVFGEKKDHLLRKEVKYNKMQGLYYNSNCTLSARQHIKQYNQLSSLSLSENPQRSVKLSVVNVLLNDWKLGRSCYNGSTLFLLLDDVFKSDDILQQIVFLEEM